MYEYNIDGIVVGSAIVLGSVAIHRAYDALRDFQRMSIPAACAELDAMNLEMQEEDAAAAAVKEQ